MNAVENICKVLRTKVQSDWVKRRTKQSNPNAATITEPYINQKVFKFLLKIPLNNVHFKLKTCNQNRAATYHNDFNGSIVWLVFFFLNYMSQNRIPTKRSWTKRRHASGFSLSPPVSIKFNLHVILLFSKMIRCETTTCSPCMRIYGHFFLSRLNQVSLLLFFVFLDCVKKNANEKRTKKPPHLTVLSCTQSYDIDVYDLCICC